MSRVRSRRFGIDLQTLLPALLLALAGCAPQGAGVSLHRHACTGLEGALLRQGGGGVPSGVRIDNAGPATQLELELVREAADGGEPARSPAGSFEAGEATRMVLYSQQRELAIDGVTHRWLDVRIAEENGSGFALRCMLDDDVEPATWSVPALPERLAPGATAAVFRIGQRAGGDVWLELRRPR